MKTRILVLGAGFGGLELTTILSEAVGDRLDLTLIDKSDSFVFGFSKLDAMFHRLTPDAIRVPYKSIVKPGVRFVQDTITEIDPTTKRVTTAGQVYEADILVIALGADYDMAATPGLAEFGNEFYTVAGALKIRDVLPSFTKGHAIVGVCSTPYKCPPAPSETALMLHDYLLQRGLRDACQISFVTPFDTPIPPSPETSEALIAAYKERGINYVPSKRVKALDGGRGVVILGDDTEMPYDLFLGVPKHCVPEVIERTGLAEKGWIPADPRNLKTKVDGVYAIGDVASLGTPKAGVFAEGAARVAAASILADLDCGDQPQPYTGRGLCYIEFGAGRVGKVEVDFLSGPSVTGMFHGASETLVAEKEHFGSSRRKRWFGLE